MKYCLFLIVSIIWISCSGSKELQKKDTTTEQKIQYDESFDPLSLDDDDLILPEIVLTSNQIKGNTSANDNNGEANIPKEANGFRVQIIATQDYEKATLLEEEAKNQFSILNHKVYLIFEAPLYKIRMGDFINRSDADELKTEAKSYGYREAFIVRTKIIIDNKTENSEL